MYSFLNGSLVLHKSRTESRDLFVKLFPLFLILYLTGEFGTVIVHNEDESQKPFAQTELHNGKEASTVLEHVESKLINGTGRQLAESLLDNRKGASGNNATVEESNIMAQGSSPSTSFLGDQKMRSDSVPQARTKDGSEISSSKLKTETVSKKNAFALQDKLFSIYAAGNTVPIPFLRASDISPIALLSDNILGGMQQDSTGTVAVEALQELFAGDGQSKKGRRAQNEVNSHLPPSPFLSLFIVHLSLPQRFTVFNILQVPLPPSVYQRLTSSSTLMNLAQALAYHKM
ncbi:hypothetical protein Gohar_005140 [Gossypium harknessii]|uniref:Uncharacterized protein n=1 Tax=Gossypium harknessii TaxID=34285 RepID=A0A7J9H9N0_9ROSI|nr:hypothetical protein [Gossypium harknessii]